MKIKGIIKNYKQSFTQFIIFCLIWFSWAAIHLWITYILTEFLSLYYLISYYIWQIIWSTNNFLLNKYFNFKDKSKLSIKQYIISMTLYITTWLLSWYWVYLLTDKLWIWYILSSAIVIPFVALINFLLHKFFIFNNNVYEKNKHYRAML